MPHSSVTQFGREFGIDLRYGDPAVALVNHVSRCGSSAVGVELAAPFFEVFPSGIFSCHASTESVPTSHAGESREIRGD